MARAYIAYIKQALIPQRMGLQAAIKSLGFKLTLEEEYAPLESAGYLPCTLDGEDAGFTLRFDQSDAIAELDTAITLQWSGDPREKVTVMIIAAALAKGYDAVIHDHNGTEKNTETLVNEAKKAFGELD